MSNDPKGDVAGKVAEFEAAATELAKSALEAEASSHELAAKRVVRLVALARDVCTREHINAYKEWLKPKGLKPNQREDVNPYGVLVKAVYGSFESGKWVPNESYKKYAGYIRYMRENHVTGEENILECIRTAKCEEFRKLKAIGMLDRAAHTNTKENDRNIELRRMGEDAEFMGVVDTPDGLQQDLNRLDGEFITLWGRVNGDTFEIKGHTELSKAQLDTLYYKLGLEIEKAEKEAKKAAVRPRVAPVVYPLLASLAA